MHACMCACIHVYPLARYEHVCMCESTSAYVHREGGGGKGVEIVLYMQAYLLSYMLNTHMYLGLQSSIHVYLHAWILA